jgi:hypothetical protein
MPPSTRSRSLQRAHLDILSTTWEELLATELIETLPADEYLLTERGWSAGIIAMGEINESAFQSRIGTVFAALNIAVTTCVRPDLTIRLPEPLQVSL